MDLTDTIAPKSDQLNSDDLLTGPRTFTVDHVSAGSAEQPVDIHLVEFPGRPYRPSKSMRRVLVAAWGPDAANYVGRRVTLFRDPSVQFGGAVVGGIKISHLSGIDKRLTMALTATRGKKAMHVVEPLPDVVPTPAEPTAAQVASSVDRDALRGWWQTSGAERRAQIQARVAELDALAPDEDLPEDLLGGMEPDPAA